MKAYIAEIGFNKPGLQVRYAHPGMGYVNAQSVGKGFHGRLCGTINIASGIGCIAGYAADINHMAVVTAYHFGYNKACNVQQSFHVGINHTVPVVEVPFVFGFQSLCQPGIVNQYINGFPVGMYAFDGQFHLLTVAYIYAHGHYLALHLLVQPG